MAYAGGSSWLYRFGAIDVKGGTIVRDHRSIYQIREDELQAWIGGMLTRFGWRWTHNRPARGSGQNGRVLPTGGSAKGFPDIFAVHPGEGRAIAMELKSMAGRVAPEQEGWIEALNASGIEARVVRPDDVDEVEEWVRPVSQLTLSGSTAAWPN
ncbi:VRR-NUC domain-containing protein [Actinomycetota bacterium]